MATSSGIPSHSDYVSVDMSADSADDTARCTGLGPWSLFVAGAACGMIAVTTKGMPDLVAQVPSDLAESVDDPALLTSAVMVGAYVAIAIRLFCLTVLVFMSRWVERRIGVLIGRARGIWRLGVAFLPLLMVYLVSASAALVAKRGLWTLGTPAVVGAVLSIVLGMASVGLVMQHYRANVSWVQGCCLVGGLSVLVSLF